MALITSKVLLKFGNLHNKLQLGTIPRYIISVLRTDGQTDSGDGWVGGITLLCLGKFKQISAPLEAAFVMY